jgi:hypothetical protein
MDEAFLAHLAKSSGYIVWAFLVGFINDIIQFQNCNRTTLQNLDDYFVILKCGQNCTFLN